MSDLLDLARWRVPRDYTLAMVGDGYQPLSAEAVIDLHLRKVTPAMVKGLRKDKAQQSASNR